jgi:hypothetical protein
MKKLFITAATIILLTTLSGCLATLHPLFTEKDLVFDPRLLGRWKEGNGGDIITFEQGTAASFNQLPEKLRSLSTKAYLMTSKEDGHEVKNYCFLIRLGKELYLDFYPCENDLQKNYDGFYKQHLTKMHIFYRLRFNSDRSFNFQIFDGDFLKKLIDNKQIRIKHEVRFDGSYVITASTEELQQYVMKYADVEGALGKEDIVYAKLPEL